MATWKYNYNLCVACEVKEETIEHFLTCKSYESKTSENSWIAMKGSSIEKRMEISQEVKERQQARKKIIEQYEAGHPQSHPGSRAPGNC